MVIRCLTAALRKHWLFAARLAVFPLVLASLLLPPVGLHPTLADWSASFVAAVVSLAGSRWPLLVLYAQLALLVTLWATPTHFATGTVLIFAALAIVEVVVHRRGAVMVSGAAVAAVIIMLNIARSTGFAPVPLMTRMLLIIGGTVLVAALVRTVRTTIRQAEERAREVERRRESDTRAARAEERTAIARELHDLVAHHLSSIVLRTGVARHVVKDPADARVGHVLDEVHEDASAALNDLRLLVSVLRDPDRVGEEPGVSLVEADLPAALEGPIERTRQAGLDVAVRIDPAISELDTMRRLAVLRLAQEGLTNVLRHAAGATRVALTIEQRQGRVRVEVHDDGAGRGVSDPYGDGGHGLAGMRERVDLVGGRFVAGPASDTRGWRVLAELPAPARTMAAS